MSRLSVAPSSDSLIGRHEITFGCSSTRWRLLVPISQKGFGGPRKSVSIKLQPSKQKNQEGNPANADDGKKKAVVLEDGSKELQSVIKSIEKNQVKRRTPGLDIDKDVAAKGKVDFVKVESWGDGGQEEGDLDNLKVKSFSPAFSSSDNSAPFYERLVHRLQLLESKGELSVVQAQSLPQFQDWAFGEKRYIQYLVDQSAVFDALRFSVSSIEDLANGDAGDTSEDITLKEAAMAVGLFNDSLGLERSEAVKSDINALLKAMNFMNGIQTEQPKPTTQTTAYVKYLKQLVRVACSEENGRHACFRLLAHIFAVYVSHLTTGMRIGAKALDCIPILKQAKGVSFYRDYPKHVSDPLKVFIATINKLTNYISQQEDQEMIMEELPRAMQKTSLLLVVLAVKEEQSIRSLPADPPVT